jgi:phosphatidylglycerol:prolipoprotein diacylglycerol transferase
MHPVLLDIFGIKVYSYGVMLVTGFLLGVWLAAVRAKKLGIETARILDLSFYVLIAGVIGAKIPLFLKEPSYYFGSFKAFLTLLRSGGVILGGLIFAVATAVFYLRKHKLDSWTILDLAGPSIILGQAVGRIGCFLAGCCWGKVCDCTVAVTFTSEAAHQHTGVPLNVPMHPTQLYSSFADFLIFFFLTWFYSRRAFKGQVFLLYGILYSVARFILEFFRGDMARITIGGPLSDAQYLCITGFLIGSFFYLKRRKTSKA